MGPRSKGVGRSCSLTTAAACGQQAGPAGSPGRTCHLWSAPIYPRSFHSAICLHCISCSLCHPGRRRSHQPRIAPQRRRRLQGGGSGSGGGFRRLVPARPRCTPALLRHPHLRRRAQDPKAALRSAPLSGRCPWSIKQPNPMRQSLDCRATLACRRSAAHAQTFHLGRCRSRRQPRPPHQIPSRQHECRLETRYQPPVSLGARACRSLQPAGAKTGSRRSEHAWPRLL